MKWGHRRGEGYGETIKQLYEEYKPLLCTIAYQLTGSMADAEDLVQDLFVKLTGLDLKRLYDPKNYLCKMIVNRCYDYLGSAQKRREQYTGPWLPEPVPTDVADPGAMLLKKDMLSYGMLVLLERLTPVERTVFVLREALSFDYASIGKIVEKSEGNCRKILSRARRKVGNPGKAIRRRQNQRVWIEQFLEELRRGNVEKILSLLAEDVVVTSDGGGKVTAAFRPVISAEKVARFLLGLLRKYQGVQYRVIGINAEDGLLIRAGGQMTVALFQLEGGKMKKLYLVRNPEKLTWFKNL